MQKIYGKWYPWEDLIAILLMIYYALKRKRVKELLEEKIIKAKNNASKKECSAKQLYEHQIEYEKLDNLFALFFKEVDKSELHSFEEKIAYCLQKYKIESQKHLTASRVIILQSNFLAGAEKTLYLYFTLNKTLPKGLKGLFSKEEYYTSFIKVLSDNNYLIRPNKLDERMKKTFIAGILTWLKKQGVIKIVTDVELADALKSGLNYEISTSTFSNAAPYPVKDSEKKLFNDFSEVFKITY